MIGENRVKADMQRRETREGRKGEEKAVGVEDTCCMQSNTFSLFKLERG